MTGRLISPHIDIRGSYVEALREFHAEDRNTDLDPDDLLRPDAFAAFVARLHAEARPETPRPENWVPGTTFWFVDGNEFLGTLQIRHELTETLRTVGGHIGYEVRPSARRRGHATEMLRQSLPFAYALGIDPALVTCDDTNLGSRRAIEANGGVPDEPIGAKLRFWVATSSSSRSAGSPT